MPDWLWKVLEGLTCLLVLAAIVHLARRQRRRGRGCWVWLVATIAVLIAPLAVDDGFGALQGIGERATVTRVDSPTGANRFTFVWWPGVINSGSLTFESYRQLLGQYGPTYVVDNPIHSLDDADTINQLMTILKRPGLAPPVFEGTSHGGMAEVALMRAYRAAGQPAGPIAGFISDSQPADASDVKWPVPTWVPYVLRGGPLSEPLWRRYMWHQDAEGPQGSLPHGDSDALYQAHHAAVMNWPLNGSTAQSRALMADQPPNPGEFDDVPTLFIRTANDGFVNNVTALPKLQAAFPHNQIVQSSGIHGNVVELAAERRQAIEPFLHELADD